MGRYKNMRFMGGTVTAVHVNERIRRILTLSGVYKMLDIELSEEKRDGKDSFKKLDMADYAKKSFGMFGGKDEKVRLLVHNDLAGVMIDRFGRDIMMIPADDEHITINVDVRVSRQFLAWVFSLGPQVKILGPAEVVTAMQEETRRMVEQYGISKTNDSRTRRETE